MKIEIAENLTYSYLKHIEGCRVVQTNWKTSGQWHITEYDKKQSKILFQRIQNSPLFYGIFKNSSFEQLIKQAEIDVLGLNTIEKSIFGIDVAFHNDGLLYGGREETSLRIFKKLFRTIFVMQTYFSDFAKFNSFFISPKVNPAQEKSIRALMQEAEDLISDESIKIDFISNEDFFKRIIDPVLKTTSNENDTAELFARTVKLLKLDGRKTTSTEIIENKSTKHGPLLKTEKMTQDGMKIGQFVQYNIKKLFDHGLLSPEEVAHLQDLEYCKKTFGQNFEVLRNSNLSPTSSDGRPRYYANEKFCGGYYLTSQWVERHWSPFLEWLDKIESKQNQ